MDDTSAQGFKALHRRTFEDYEGFAVVVIAYEDIFEPHLGEASSHRLPQSLFRRKARRERKGETSAPRLRRCQLFGVEIALDKPRYRHPAPDSIDMDDVDAYAFYQWRLTVMVWGSYDSTTAP